ncbi:MAG: ATP-binding protein [Thermodesulfobacteriota bacterium]|nr:ATP-binding protein [Thermodesulfobacteriota bacterium]
MKKGYFKTNVRVSTWLATSAVVILIILLALTINHAQEKGIVEQFSRQQATIASGAAAVIEDLIISAEKSMIILSRLPAEDGIKSEESIKTLYDTMEGKIQFIARLNEKGLILCSYPPSPLKKIAGKNLGGYFSLQEIKKTKEPYISNLILPKTEQDEEGKPRINSIVIAIPELNAKGEFAGLVLATLSLKSIMDRYVRQVGEIESSRPWIIDENGVFISHPNPDLIGSSVKLIAANTGVSLKKLLLKGKKGYGEYVLRNNKGKAQKSIIAYAPIHVGSNIWSVAIATPYNTVIALIRKAFVSIILGAAGLIVAVIITGMAIAHSGVRRLRRKEELKRLKERDDWKGKLLREKKTVEGITEGSPVPTFVINREHKVTFWNKACAELTGYDVKDMIATDNHYKPFYSEKRPLIADIIIDYDIEDLIKYYGAKRVKRSETLEGAYEARDFFKNLGGKDRYLYFLAAPIYDEKGEIISAIETIQDVSKEHEMAHNLREYAETLKNELAENINLRKEIEGLYNYLQSIVDSLPDKIFDLSSDGIINYVSKDMKREGVVSKGIKGKHFTEFADPENRELVLRKWADAKKGIFLPWELEATARDGSRRSLLITPCPVKGADRYVLVQRDITEFKSLEKKYYESQKLAAVGQLSAGIAHEVRNPLSSIKMSLKILEKRIQPAGNDLKRFKIAQREVEHLEKIVNDILIFAKPAEPQKASSNIKKILEHAFALVEKSILDKHIHVQTRFEEDMPTIEVDSAMLEHAFLNIYRNAIDAMNTGGNLLISTNRASHESIIIEIEDNGCGIDKKDLPHLFNPFFTRKRYGTGLGLSQVKKIIEQHGGMIEILSVKGEGTKFIVTLPISQQDMKVHTAMSE